MLWFAGLFACWARVAQGLWAAYQLTASAAPVGQYGRATVHETVEHSIPFTWGFLRPAILLPVDAQHWNSNRRDHVLAHEHAHVQRADWLTQTIAQLLCGFYWFHPAIWYAAARMRRESERACDDAVVRAGCIAEEYAEDLLDLARHDTKQQQQTPVATVAMWSRSQLEERIMRILNNPDRRGVSRLAAIVLSFGAVVTLAPLASVTLLAQSTITYEGNVSDPSGARVPGVSLRIVEGKNTLTSTVSGADGSYKLAFPTPAIASGPFLLIAEKPGFAAASYPIGGFGTKRDFIRDIALNMGQIRENVLVEGVRTTPRAATSTSPQRIRVGGNVQAANLINRTEPEYPKELQEKGIEGTVELEAIISKEGNMLSVHPRSRAVDQGLIDAATKAVQTWQYRPTLLNGNPVEIVTTVTVRFLLK
jgi:TonB family protein